MHESEATCRPRRRRHAFMLLPTLAAALAAALPVQAAEPDTDGWRLSGDLRAGYFTNTTTARDGSEDTSEALNARLRAALDRQFDARWRMRVRAAARLSDDQDGMRGYLRDHAPTRTGTRFGDATLDEAYLAYAAPGDGVRVRVGRFQVSHSLASITGKGLERVDGASLDVTWTDGIHVELPLGAGWRGHAIAEHRPARGWTGTVRAPLDFSDSNARASLFVAVENPNPLGPVTQRMLSATWMPASIPRPGDPGARGDYGTVDARIAAGWPLGAAGRKFVAGVEVGHAFGTPDATLVGTGGTGRSEGLAWQLAASLYDIAPGHHLGLVHGDVGAGWLVSPDFRANERQTELRYQWRIDPKTSVEARVRLRTELRAPASGRERRDEDAFLRVTRSF